METIEKNQNKRVTMRIMDPLMNKTEVPFVEIDKININSSPDASPSTVATDEWTTFSSSLSGRSSFETAVPMESTNQKELYTFAQGLEVLKESFDRFQQTGKDEVVFIAGKNADTLTENLSPNRIHLSGRFLSKEQQVYHRNEPLSVFNSIFQQFVGMLRQQENQDLLESLQLQIEKDFQYSSEEYSCLIRTFPQLKLLFPDNKFATAKYPVITDLWIENDPLTYASWKHHFYCAFDRFLNLLSTHSPVTLVLNDVQWADNASMELIKTSLLSSNTIKNDLKRMVVLTVSDIESESLTKRTNGCSFLTLLDSIEFTNISISDESEAFQDSIIALERLDEDDQSIAWLAFVLGMNPTPLRLLTIVYKSYQCRIGNHTKANHNILDNLTRMKDCNLISSIEGDQIVWMNNLGDIVQSENTKSLNVLLRNIADDLADSLSETENDYWVYLLADLHNYAGVVGEKENKTAKVANLNFRAVNRAVFSGSLDAALRYLCHGLNALKKAASTKKHHHQDLERSMLKMLLRVSACQGDDYWVRQSSLQLLNERRTRMKMLEIFIIRQTRLDRLLSKCSSNPEFQGLAVQGTNQCFAILSSDFGVNFATKDIAKSVTIAKGLSKLKAQAKTKHTTTNPSALLELLTMKNPLQLSIMKLLDTCANFCYLSGDLRFPLVVLKSIEFSQRNGRSIYSPVAYTLAGILIITAFEDFRGGTQYANHALAWLQRQSLFSATERSIQARTIALSHFLILPWSRRIQSSLNQLIEASKTSIQLGDSFSASYAISNYITLSVLGGTNLTTMQEECVVYVKQIQSLNRVKMESTCQIWWYFVLQMTGHVSKRNNTSTGPMDEEKIMKYVLKTKDEDTLCIFQGAKAILYTIQGSHQLAADHAIANSENIFKTLRGHPLLMFLPLYMGISLFHVAKRSKQGIYKKFAKKMLSLTKEYNKKGNPNVLHHSVGLEAEMYILSGGRHNYQLAFSRYQSAISIALMKGFTQEAALLNERYSTFLKDQMGNHHSSSDCFQRAIQLYEQWGALEKVKSLKSME